MSRLSLAAAVMVIIACFASCKDNPSSPSDGPILLRGSIDDGNAWTGAPLTIQVARPFHSLTLDSTRVDSGGTFAMNMPFPAPPDSMLAQLTFASDSNQYAETVDERISSNPASLLTTLSFNVYTRHNIGFYLFNGNRYLTSDSGSAVGDYHVDYIYANQPTSITGSLRITYLDSLFIRDQGRPSFITIYDLQLIAGWNKVTTVIRASDSEVRIFQVTDEVFPDAAWFVAPMISRNFYSSFLL